MNPVYSDSACIGGVWHTPVGWRAEAMNRTEISGGDGWDSEMETYSSREYAEVALRDYDAKLMGE